MMVSDSNPSKREGLDVIHIWIGGDNGFAF